MSKHVRVLLLLFLSPLPLLADNVTDQADRYYTQAVVAQKKGDTLAARNAARKYAAFCRLRPDACSAVRLKEMAALIPDAPLPSPEPSPVVMPTPISTEKKPRVKPAFPKIDREKLKQTTEQLVREAEMARERGQLEQALNLYRLAEKAEPDNPEFKDKITGLEELME